MNQRQRDRGAGGGLVGAGVLVLSLTCAAAIYRAAAAGDVGSTAFVSVSYGALVMLLRFLRAYELTPRNAAAERERLRSRIWALCTLLTALFAWKVAAVVPPAVAIGVWAAAAATSVAGFVALFQTRRP